MKILLGSELEYKTGIKVEFHTYIYIYTMANGSSQLPLLLVYSLKPN